MKELEKFHDECLEHEIFIEMSVEKLDILREKSLKSGDSKSFKEIIPALDTVIEEIEKYKDFLVEAFARMEEK